MGKSALHKGDYEGVCNRTVCDNSPAIYFNHSTQKYYCTACARLINQMNHEDAMRLYGHNLCTVAIKPLPT